MSSVEGDAFVDPVVDRPDRLCPVEGAINASHAPPESVRWHHCLPGGCLVDEAGKPSPSFSLSTKEFPMMFAPPAAGRSRERP